MNCDVVQLPTIVISLPHTRIGDSKPFAKSNATKVVAKYAMHKKHVVITFACVQYNFWFQIIQKM